MSHFLAEGSHEGNVQTSLVNLQPAVTLLQPMEGFQVASVHSIFVCFIRIHRIREKYFFVSRQFACIDTISLYYDRDLNLGSSG